MLLSEMVFLHLFLLLFYCFGVRVVFVSVTEKSEACIQTGSICPLNSFIYLACLLCTLLVKGGILYHPSFRVSKILEL